MKNRTTATIVIFFLFTTFFLAQNNRSEERVDTTKTKTNFTKSINGVAATGDDILIKDVDGNSLIRIIDEGNFGVLQLKNGTPSILTNKIYSQGNKLFYNGEQFTISGSDTSSGWQDNGSSVILRDATDSVGIGITNPTNKLSVNGTVKMTGFKLSTGASNGHVLTTNANGVGTWQASSGGSGTDNDWTIIGNDMYSNNSGNIGIGVNNPIIKLHVKGNDGVIFDGFSGSQDSLNLGAGTRFMWYMKTEALRAGSVEGNQWNNSEIGKRSFATGYSTIASLDETVALGEKTTANNYNATAMGSETTASGQFSTAFGKLTTASGNSSTSFGKNTTAQGNTSISFGLNTTAEGPASTVFGKNTKTDTTQTPGSANASVAMGISTKSLGQYSVSLGTNTNADAYSSLVIGSYNIGGGNPISSTIATDPLFEIGNGDSFNPSNALTVLKNGNLGIGIEIPTNSLDVNGTTKINGISLTTGANNGYILISDTSGVGSWKSPSSINDDDWIINGNDMYSYHSGQVGIGTGTPIAKLHGKDGNGVLFEGVFNSGNIPIEGVTGRRLMWYPSKAAFRVGYVFSDVWNSINTGNYSVAMGKELEASGSSATAIGSNNKATNSASTALGWYTNATGIASTSSGFQNSSTAASGNYSTAMGINSVSSGEASTAMGYYSSATGNKSTSFGESNEAGGYASTAFGYKNEIRGNFSTGIGYKAGKRSDKQGSVVFTGDTTRLSAYFSQQSNRFDAIYQGGYRFYTNSNYSSGVKMDEFSNSWSSISDSTKKENFKSTNGEEILNKISKFKLTSWNYKGQDKSKFRHYGPMAQDFYSAFGHDGVGTIGNDTTIASADIDGIIFNSVQALIERNNLLTEKSSIIQEQINILTDEIEKLEFVFIQTNDEYFKPYDYNEKLENSISTSNGISTDTKQLSLEFENIKQTLDEYFKKSNLNINVMYQFKN